MNGLTTLALNEIDDSLRIATHPVLVVGRWIAEPVTRQVERDPPERLAQGGT